jgi:outer membrane protein OmpA-like peptidoglycan-associated protein
VLEEFGQRFIVRRGDQLMICQDEEADTERLLYRARDVEVEPLRGGRTRTTVHRADGTMIVTERDRFGAVISRTRIDADGERFVLFDDSEFQRDEAPRRVTLFEDELPPLEVDIPREEYVVETRQANRRAIRRALEAPLVEEAERVYSRDEVRSSRRLRDKVRRIDLNTITFDFGSAALSPSQFRALRVVGEAIEQVLEDRPYEVFLIEGHTDAVGTEYANLLLSDRRAEAVAIALSSNFDIPPENLVTQGYGQQYLKIDTQRPERENRRVAVRRITELVRAER